MSRLHGRPPLGCNQQCNTKLEKIEGQFNELNGMFLNEESITVQHVCLTILFGKLILFYPGITVENENMRILGVY